MVYIEKQSPPEELIQAKRNGLQAYSDMDTPTKDAVKKSLFQEQNGLCAYCMRKMNSETMQIEHYKAQNPDGDEQDLELSIDYKNMLGVCPGQKGIAKRQDELTCDQHRGNTDLSVNPQNIRSIEKIKYSYTGRIFSDDEAIDKDLDKVLNLNCKSARLCENRRAVLAKFQEWVANKYSNRHLTKEKWLDLYQEIAKQVKQNPIEYVGIIQWYIKKKVK